MSVLNWAKKKVKNPQNLKAIHFFSPVGVLPCFFGDRFFFTKSPHNSTLLLFNIFFFFFFWSLLFILLSHYLDSAEGLQPGAPFHSRANIPMYSNDIRKSGTT